MSDAAHPRNCVVPDDKILRYLLSDSSRDGAGKAAFFKACGFRLEDWRQLAAALARHPERNVVVDRPPSLFGAKFVVECSLETPDGSNPCVRSFWITRPGETGPSLLTAYPNRR